MTMELADDQPISRQHNNGALINADTFDRIKLVTAAARLLEHNVPELGSMVFGIEGPWGCGKTSFKNMVIAQIENDWMTTNQQKDNKLPYPVIVDFNPWMFSNGENVTEMLFATIRAKLQGEPNELKDAQQQWSQRVKNGARELSASASKATETAGSAMDVFPVTEAAWKAISQGLHTVSGLFNSISQNLKPNPEKPLGLEQAHRDLVESLKMQGNDFRMYVFIDEIDRLDDQAIISIFKSLKAVGDLPRTVYIPIYDRRIVTKALGQASRFSGEDYLDKIVQMPIVMPAVPFKPAADGVLEQCGLSKLGETDSNMCKQVLSTYITNKRDANRLSNAYILRHETLRCETDPADLLLRHEALRNETDSADLFAITAIQLFHPSLAEWIQMEQARLTDQGFIYSDEESISILTAYAETIGEKPNSYRISKEAQLLRALFPDNKKNPESRRIRFSNHFGTYFTLTPKFSPAHSRAEILHWLQVLSDPSSDQTITDEDFLNKVPHTQLRDDIQLEPIQEPERIAALLSTYRSHYPDIQSYEREGGQAIANRKRYIRNEIDAMIIELLRCADDQTVRNHIDALARENSWRSIIQLIHIYEAANDVSHELSLVKNDHIDNEDYLDKLPDMTSHKIASHIGIRGADKAFHDACERDLTEMLSWWQKQDSAAYGQMLDMVFSTNLPWDYLAMAMIYVSKADRSNDYIIDGGILSAMLLNIRYAGDTVIAFPETTIVAKFDNFLEANRRIPSAWTATDFRKIAALRLWATEKIKGGDLPKYGPDVNADDTDYPSVYEWVDPVEDPYIIVRPDNLQFQETVDLLEHRRKEQQDQS